MTINVELEKRIVEMDALALENRRRAIVTGANGDFNALSTEQLQELAYIVSALRRRNSGPPKAAKPKAEKATIDSLL